LRAKDLSAGSIERALTGELKIPLWGEHNEGSLRIRHLELPFGYVLQFWMGDLPLALAQQSGIITVYKNGLLEEVSTKQMLLETLGAAVVLESVEATVLYLKKF